MSDVRCPKCQSAACPELRGTGACPADYARSLPMLGPDRIVYAPDGTPIGKRVCPKCGSDNINATETVCLACSNRAWSDR